MTMTNLLKHWREASTLMLAAKAKVEAATLALKVPEFVATAAAAYNYKFLMLKRSTTSKFMPSTYVFPGGVVHTSDFSSDWMHLVKHATVPTKYDHTPPMLSMKRNETLSADIAFRICAIRETFEESGILLCDHDFNVDRFTHNKFSVKYFEEWRQKVNNDASNFLRMCQELNASPIISSLSLWSNWLTPLYMTKDLTETSGRRFDTLFYLYTLPEMADADHCNQETVSSQWFTPAEILYHHKQGTLWVAPPQQYEFSRLAAYKDIKQLEAFAAEREYQGTERWLPVRIKTKDGVISVLPGDSLYPEEPDVYGAAAMPQVEEVIDDLRPSGSELNRVEIKDRSDITIRCNIVDPSGHKTLHTE